MTKFKAGAKAGLLTLSLCAACQRQPSGAEMVARAQASYYNVGRLGFKGYSATVIPDWNVVNWRELTPGERHRVVGELTGLRFFIHVDAPGRAELAHTRQAVKPGPKTMLDLTDIFRGLGQTVSGFFQTWAALTIAPFPPKFDSRCRFERLGNGYRISEAASEHQIVYTFNTDLTAVTVRMTSPLDASTMSYRFKSTPEGNLLEGFDMTRIQRGLNLHVVTHFNYATVGRFRLPRTLNVTATLNGARNTMALTFTDFRPE